MGKTTKQTLLAQALARLGREKLAQGLDSPIQLVDAWLSGHASMPDQKLLDLAKLIEQLGDEHP